MGTGALNAGGNPAMDKHPILGVVETLLVASWCRNWDKLRHLAHMQPFLLGGKLVHNVKGNYEVNVSLIGPNFAHKSISANCFFKTLHKRNRLKAVFC